MEVLKSICFFICCFSQINTAFTNCSDTLSQQICRGCPVLSLSSFCQNSCNQCNFQTSFGINFGQPSGITYYIEPFGLPNCYLDFDQNNKNKIKSNCNGGIKFLLVTGISQNQGSVSFQSAADNRLYIRHSSFIIYLQNLTTWLKLPQDQSFYIHISNDGSYVLVRSTNFPSFFLQNNYADFKFKDALSTDSYFKLLVCDLNVTKIEIFSQVGYSVKVTFNPIGNVLKDYVVNYLDLNNKTISTNATNGLAIIDNINNGSVYSFFAGVKNEFNFYVYGNNVNYRADKYYLMIKKIESINRYSVKITVNSDIPAWNLTTYFVIKCIDQNNKVTFFPVTNYTSVISSLESFTVYNFSAGALNKFGVVVFGQEFSYQTDEDAPSVSPKNISVVSSDTNSILLQWKPLDPNEYHGVLKGYSILVQAVYLESDFKLLRKRRNLDKQIYNGNLLLEWATNISDPYATYFNITNLFGNTIYIINISANTKYQGVFSSGIEAKTKEGVPLNSAVNLRCDKVTYYSVTVRWVSTPPGYLQGVLTNYNLFYQNVGNGVFQNDSLLASTTSYNIINLDAFTEYKILLTAFTKVGGGEESRIMCKTDEAVPRKPPSGLTATSYEYPNATYLTWIDILSEDWRGEPLGFTIAYMLLNQGDAIVPNQSWLTLNISYSNQLEYLLNNLSAYSQYSLKIAGYNSKGTGLFSSVVTFATCHIVDPVIKINYISVPPFASSTILSSLQPVGIMIASTEQSLLKCAHFCTSFLQNITFVYTELNNTSSQLLNMNSTTITLPVTVPLHVLYTGSYSSVIQLPGFVVLFIPSNTSVQLEENQQVLFKNVSIALGTFGMYFLLNCLFGVIFFYCQHENSQRKGCCFTLNGIFDEIYFSIITIATVGYGDKIPSKIFSRMFIIGWTFLGLILTSICVANLISALTVDVITSLNYLSPKGNVIAKLGSPEYAWASKISSINLLKGKNYSSHSEVLDALKAGKAKYAIIDQYSVEAYREVLQQYDIKILKALNADNSFYGVLLGGNYNVFQSCISKLLRNNSAKVNDGMYEFKLETMIQNNSRHLNLTRTKIQLLSIQSPIMTKILYGMIVALIIVLIIGGMYDVYRMKFKKSRVAQSPSLEKKLTYLQDMKNLSEEYLTEYQDMIDRLQIKTDLLLYKHAEQRWKLRNKYSKTYGVNFKYVNLNDLGLSLEQILELREEIRRCPKKTFWKRLFENTTKKFAWLRIQFAA